MRILLIEDEPQMAVALRGALTRHDMVMDHVSTLCDAELVIGDGAYDAVLLDRQLPDGDGLELIPKIRKKGLTLPIIVITAKGEVPDRITGLETGADDY
ncbi:response regulator transcription factor, partial [Rhizobium ruizarguesonis]